MATEAATAVRDYAFGELSLSRLVSLIQQGNLTSRRVAEKVGMHLEREIVQHGRDYWLYAVFNCGSMPELHPVQDPARLGWEPIVKIDHYHTSAEQIIGGESR